jgi:hypothetical protein
MNTLFPPANNLLGSILTSQQLPHQHSRSTMATRQSRPILEHVYRRLQLDSDDHRRWAAFNAFCWQHIHQHTRSDPDWIAKSSIRLTDNIQETPDKPEHRVWDDKFSEIAYDFFETYSDRIWPDQLEAPAHIYTRAPWADSRMHGSRSIMTITAIHADKLRSQGVEITEQVSKLESRIGIRARAYLMHLITSSESIPKDLDTTAMQLFQDFVDITPPQSSYPKDDRSATTTSDIAADDDDGSEEGEIADMPVVKRRRTTGPSNAELIVGKIEQLRRKGSSFAQPTESPLQISEARSEVLDAAKNPINKPRQPRTREPGSKNSPDGDHRSRSPSTSEVVGPIEDTGDHASAASMLRVRSATSDDLRTNPRVLAMSGPKYCCWLGICHVPFSAVKQLTDHLENHYPDEYLEFVDTAAEPDDGTSQQTMNATDREYYCWLHVCSKVLRTPKQVHEHVEHKHPDEYSAFLSAAISLTDEPSQLSPPQLDLQSNTKTNMPEVANVTEIW